MNKVPPKHWTINGDFIALKPTGVPRYAREVTLALDALIFEKHPLTEGLSFDLVAPREADDLPLRSIPVKVVPEFNKPRFRKCGFNFNCRAIQKAAWSASAISHRFLRRIILHASTICIPGFIPKAMGAASVLRTGSSCQFSDVARNISLPCPAFRARI